jgi:HPt (histidine-containing phosphotransfer) domain-containing protein
MPELLHRIETTYNETDFEAVAAAAHSLKSASANLGAFNLAALCRKIQSCADCTDIRGLTRQPQLIQNECEWVRDALEQLSMSHKSPAELVPA